MVPRTATPFSLMPEEFGTLFNRLLTWPILEEPEPWALTMEEREKEIVVRAELPGFAPEEVRVELLGERLTIAAEHRVPAEGAPENTEREVTRVRRLVTIPPSIDPARIEAVYRNGVLEVHLPRLPEAMARRIEVKI